MVESVSYTRDDGRGEVSMAMHAPVAVRLGMSPYALCRACAARMSIRSLERLVLVMLVDWEETGTSVPCTYADLGAMVGKSASAAEKAVAVLRTAGLVVTSRVGRYSPVVAFSCASFVRWATCVVAGGGDECRDADSRRRVAYEAAKAVAEKAVEERQPDPAPAALEERPGFSGVGMAPAYDGEFDATAERRSTMRASGRETGVQPEFDISFGSDTAESDMGHGVRVNPNI